jgi:hypothetical protein
LIEEFALDPVDVLKIGSKADARKVLAGSELSMGSRGLHARDRAACLPEVRMHEGALLRLQRPIDRSSDTDAVISVHQGTGDPN